MSLLRTWLGLAAGPLVGWLALELVFCSAPFARLVERLVPHGEPQRVERVLDVAGGQPVDIVVMGSSVAVRNVDERQIDHVLGTTTINLGVNQAPMISNAAMLPEVLDLNPQVVLVVVDPSAIRSNDPDDNVFFYDPRVAAAVYEPGEIATDLPYHLHGSLLWASNVYQHRWDTRDWMYTPHWPKGRRHPRNTVEPTKERFRNVALRTRDQLAALELDPQGLNLRALAWMADACNRAGVDLVVTVTPLHPAASKEGYRADVIRAVFRSSRQNGFTMIPPKALGAYGSPAFHDPLHFGKKGAQRYTRAVTGQLRRTLAKRQRALQ